MTARLHFVLGTGRCGSTLVHELLCRHPRTAFLSNLEDRMPVPASAARWSGTVYRRLPASFTRKGRVRFAPSEGYRVLDRKVSPVIATSHRDLVETDATPWLSARTRTFFESRAGIHPDHAYLHKFTGWPRARFLHAVFPEAKYVHVVRDGRAVVSSWLQMPWWLGYRGPSQWHWGALSAPEERVWTDADQSFVALAAIGWKRLVDTYEETKAALPPDSWLDVRYEDVVADPDGQLGRILDFLGLPPSLEMRRAVEQYGFDPDRTDAYRRDLGQQDLRWLESSLAEHLDRYGYDRAVAPLRSVAEGGR